MAKSKGNLLIEGMSGAIGKQIVFKKYMSGTFISKYPDMSKVVPTEKQLAAKYKFKKAVEYAKELLSDPETKNELIKRTPKDRKPYHYAIAEYMRDNNS